MRPTSKAQGARPKSAAIPAPKVWVHPLARSKWVRGAGRPSKGLRVRLQPETSSPEEGFQTRCDSAKSLVTLSCSWAPRSGIQSTERLASSKMSASALQDRAVNRLSVFEAAANYGHKRAWIRWAKLAQDHERAAEDPSAELFEAWLYGVSTAPTLPRALWSHAFFLKRYLMAPLPVLEVDKPAGRRAGPSGLVEEESNAIVMEPEMLIMLEAVIKELYLMDDWRLFSELCSKQLGACGFGTSSGPASSAVRPSPTWPNASEERWRLMAPGPASSGVARARALRWRILSTFCGICGMPSASGSRANCAF